MNFRRRLYYSLNDGSVLFIQLQIGMFEKNYSPELEADILGLSNWGVMEWSEPDEAIEAAFSNIDSEGQARIVNASVNISTNPPTLEFSYSEPVEPEQPQDYAGIIDILTGEVE